MPGATPNYRRRRTLTVLIVALALAAVVAIVWISASTTSAISPAVSPSPSASAIAEPTPEPTPTTTPEPPAPTCDPNDVGALINKLHPICPPDYVPELVTVGSTGGELRPEAATAMDAMAAALTAETGTTIFSASAYRSYDTQVSTYGGWVEQDGQEAADRYSARPGFSEHQTGLAMDLGASSCGCTDEPFGTTPEGIWVAANAWQFGYIVRYPDGYESVTGYIWEPWHVRYVGPAIAQAMHDAGVVTLEDYYAAGPAPNYG
jgi:D-alanyl-D-alanine carboxypeptidase